MRVSAAEQTEHAAHLWSRRSAWLAEWLLEQWRGEQAERAARALVVNPKERK
jgi:hypothetical protein